MMYHTPQCSKAHAEAETRSGINLFHPDCPRCRLNFAAPKLLGACKIALPIIEGERIRYDNLPPKSEIEGCHNKAVREVEHKLKAAIAKAEGVENETH